MPLRRAVPVAFVAALIAGAAGAALLGSQVSSERSPWAPTPAGGGHLTTEDGRIVDEDGRPVVLRGVNVFVTKHAEPPSAEDFERIRDLGFNVVRLVAQWHELEPDPPSGEERRYDEEAVRRIDEAIEAAREAGLYSVLDPVHLFGLSPAFDGRGVPAWVYDDRGLSLETAAAGIAQDEVLREHLDALLRWLAERYGDEPAVAALDPVNEPPSAPASEIVDWYGHMADVVHDVAPDLIVMVEPRFGDHDMTLAGLERLEGRDNLVLSPHFYYGGGSGNGYGENGDKVGSYVFDGRTPYWGGASDELAAHLGQSLDAAAEAGMPVWIGEFGIGVDEEGAETYLEELTRLFADEKLGWAYWIYDSPDDDRFNLVQEDGNLHPVSETLSEGARAGVGSD